MLTQSVPTHPGASLHLSQLNKLTHRGCDTPPDAPARDKAPGSANPTDTSRRLSQPRRPRQSPRAWNSRGAERRRPSPRLTRTRDGRAGTAAGMRSGRLPASHTHAPSASQPQGPGPCPSPTPTRTSVCRQGRAPSHTHTYPHLYTRTRSHSLRSGSRSHRPTLRFGPLDLFPHRHRPPLSTSGFLQGC